MNGRDKKRAQEIVQRAFPKATPAAQSQYEGIPGLDQPSDAPDLHSADLDALRRRYFGEHFDGRDATSSREVLIEDLDEPTQSMVDMEVELGPGQKQTKTFIVSEEDDEIIGQQG